MHAPVDGVAGVDEAEVEDDGLDEVEEAGVVGVGVVGVVGVWTGEFEATQ